MNRGRVCMCLGFRCIESSLPSDNIVTWQHTVGDTLWCVCLSRPGNSSLREMSRCVELQPTAQPKDSRNRTVDDSDVPGDKIKIHATNDKLPERTSERTIPRDPSHFVPPVSLVLNAFILMLVGNSTLSIFSTSQFWIFLSVFVDLVIRWGHCDGRESHLHLRSYPLP